MADVIEESRLKRLIANAKQLGFWDDVEHWESELKKLKEKES